MADIPANDEMIRGYLDGFDMFIWLTRTLKPAYIADVLAL